MDHELLRQHAQLATVRVGQGNEARTLLAREGAYEADAHGHLQLRASSETACDARRLAPIWKILAIAFPV